MPSTPRRQHADPRRSPIPFTLSMRVTDAQYRGLLLLAETGETSLGGAARELMNAALRAMPMTGGPHAGKSLLQALEDDPNLTGLPGAWLEAETHGS